MTRNRQVGLDASATILAALVPRISYKPNWTFELSEISRGQGCEGLTLLISFQSPNSLNHNEQTEGVHLMPVLPCAYDEESWLYWIFEQVEMVEHHEAMEFFCVDGEQPYFPEHGPGRNPYRLCKIKSREQVEDPAIPWTGGPPQDEHFAA
jgi:hypothetical protein